MRAVVACLRWDSDYALDLRDRHDEQMNVQPMDEVDFVERWEASQQRLADGHMKRTFDKLDGCVPPATLMHLRLLVAVVVPPTG